MSNSQRHIKRHIDTGRLSSVFYEARKRQICKLLDDAADEFLKSKLVRNQAEKSLADSLGNIKKVIVTFQKELELQE